MNIFTHNTLDNIHELSEVITSPFDVLKKKKIETMSNEKEKTAILYSPSCESLSNTDHILFEEFFNKNKCPNLKEKHELVSHLKSSPPKIQNKRTRIKRRSETKNNDTISSLKKSRISQTVENVIAREMSRTSNPISEVQINGNEYPVKETINNLLSLLNNSEKENKCHKDVIKNKNPAFIYGLWCGLNLFFGNASSEIIDKFINEDK
uniref:Homeobox domain-containing protein n=1 Tax=Strongyloides stercoralis TaxID=6248 RepID=A0AAF5HYJ5_STRER